MQRPHHLVTATLSVTAVFALTTLPARSAQACGCFAPPDPSVPVVQAGERIVFAHDNGQITAHIQIQYQGPAQEFGWLLPLPSLPEPLQLGVDELFAQVTNATQPKYRLVRTFDDSCNSPVATRGGAFDSASSPPPQAENDGNVVVVQNSVGPFDYAILRADSREPMFNWLVENNYFIPTGTEDVVGPYIHEGAYFLALKLRKGQEAGDIQPIVLRYPSELPMIPIILTSVAANPDMGIQVWVLGDSRAIPRNYRHTVLNDEYLDWFNAGANYNDVIIKATNEAPDGQSFVTEYAGTTSVMDNLLDYQGRFGIRSDFERTTDVGEYLGQVRNSGFLWNTQLQNMVRTYVPYPAAFARLNVTEDQFYENADAYLSPYYREQNPELFEGYEFSFDPMALTADLWTGIVEPTRNASALFDKYPLMTRLYTTLSPEEMTKDPVFSFNPDLPEVSNIHEANFEVLCDSDNGSSGILTLPDGRKFYLKDPNTWSTRDRSGVPYSRRIELLREEGPPEIEVDNSARVTPSEANSGCACSATESKAHWGWALALSALFFVRPNRRNRR